MDKFTKEKRSEIMSKIRSKNTGIERLVFGELRQRGIYFQKHYRQKGAGNIDIAQPRKKRAVFLDGDFWHGYRFFLLRDRLPQDYWRPKIEANIWRDKDVKQKLQAAGWRILRVWEHDLVKKENFPKTLKKIIDFLGD